MGASAAVVQAAHDMLARGYAIVPVREGTKAPAVERGENWRRQWTETEVLSALSDIADHAHRAAGIGFLGGALNKGIVPLDFDSDAGEAWWREQCHGAGIDPDDFPTVITPGKTVDGKRRQGTHRYVHDTRGTLGNREGALKGLNINIRGAGHVVLPPSTHPEGGVYRWEAGKSLYDFEHIPPCPDFIYDAIAKSAPKDEASGKQKQGTTPDTRMYAWCRAALGNVKSALAGCGRGSRNTELNTGAYKLGALAHYGAFNRNEAHAALEDACLGNGYIQDDGRQAFENTFASGWAAGEEKPLTPKLEDRPPPQDPQPGAKGETAPAGGIVPLPYTVVSSLAGIMPAPRSWCVPDWIPDHAMTLLAGDGGVGKSIAALQLHIACNAGIPWLGLPVDPRPSFYFSAEDPFDEVHRRVFEIAAAMGVDIAALDKFAFCSFADEDAILMAPGDRFPVVLRPTEVWERLVASCDVLGARLVTIDTAADTFGGDEIKRREVRAFVSLMNRHARAINGAMVLTSHPSLDGLRSGSGTSGSTGWNNSTRSRLYLAKPAAEGDGEQDSDPDARILTRKKANFARTGESISMRWQSGILVEAGEPGNLDRIALAAKADRVFLTLLRATYEQGIWVSPNAASRNYAPARFSKLPDREDLTRAALEAAMHRLLKAGTILVEPYGYQSNQHYRISDRKD